MFQTSLRHLRNATALDALPTQDKPDQNTIDATGSTYLVVAVNRPALVVPYWFNAADELWHRDEDNALDFAYAGIKRVPILGAHCFLRVETSAGIGTGTPVRLCYALQRALGA